MLVPPDDIDDEETLTYKQNFLQDQHTKQNFIYTIDKYKAVFSSVPTLALRILSNASPSEAGRKSATKKDSPIKRVAGGGNKKQPLTTEDYRSGFRIQGKFRFLSRGNGPADLR